MADDEPGEDLLHVLLDVLVLFFLGESRGDGLADGDLYDNVRIEDGVRGWMDGCQPIASLFGGRGLPGVVGVQCRVRGDGVGLSYKSAFGVSGSGILIIDGMVGGANGGIGTLHVPGAGGPDGPLRAGGGGGRRLGPDGPLRLGRGGTLGLGAGGSGITRILR